MGKNLLTRRVLSKSILTQKPPSKSRRPKTALKDSLKGISVGVSFRTPSDKLSLRLAMQSRRDSTLPNN